MSWAIRLTWPTGRVAWQGEDPYSLAREIEDAGLYPTKREARDRCQQYRDAKLVYGIIAEPEQVD